MNRIIYSIILFFSMPTAMAQVVAIGTTNPDVSAKLDVSGTAGGMLIPRLTSAQRTAIAAPATGLLVYQTDGTPGFCYYNGAAWINCSNGFMLNSQGIAVSFQYGVTSTFAGSGASGAVDDTGTTASFRTPAGLAVDDSGNVYVADAANHKIRKITKGAAVTTLAGDGTGGLADGTGAAAFFYEPFGIAVDKAGNVYVADTWNHCIRKITPGGVVTTLAGNGTQGTANGTGSAASFNYPYSVAVDAAGNIYVADRSSHKIRKVTPGGVVTTFAGSGAVGAADGTGITASFNNPSGVAVDAAGNVYVADQVNHKIRKITAGGVVTTLAGSGTAGAVDGTGSAASFNYPTGVTVDLAGNVFVADMNNSRIRKVTAGGVVTTLAGSGAAGSADGGGPATSFSSPTCVAVDNTGNVYVADNGSRKIRKIIAW